MTPVLNEEFPELFSSEPARRIETLKKIAKSRRRDLALELLKFAAADKDSKVRYYARKTAAFLNQLSSDDADDQDNCMDTIAAMATVAAQSRRSAIDEEPFEPPNTEIQRQTAEERDLEARRNRLREIMKTGDSKSRQKVIQGIMRLRDRALFTFVVQPFMTPDLDPIVLSAAVALAAHLGSQETGPILIPLISHQDHRVRANAVEAAGSLNLDSALPHIVGCLRDEDNRVRSNAVAAIRKIDPEITLATLKSMISSDRVEMMDSAIYCLERTGFPGASEMLRTLLDHPVKAIADKARTAMEYLAGKGDTKARSLVEDTSEITRPADEIPPTEKQLMEMISPGEPASLASEGALNSQDPRERILFLMSCETGQSEKVQPILQALDDEKDAHVLATMLTALGRIGDPRALTAIQNFLDYGDNRVRANAVEALGSFDIQDLDDILSPLTRDKNHRIVANAVVALRNSDKIDHGKILRGLSSNTDPMVRKSAIHALRRMGNTRHSAFVKRLFGDFEPEVSELARQVFDGLSQEEPRVRRNSLAALLPSANEEEPPESDRPGETESPETGVSDSGAETAGPRDETEQAADETSSPEQGGSQDISADGTPVRPPSWEFSERRFKTEASKWSDSKFEGMFNQLKKKRDEASSGLDKAMEPLALFAADNDLKTDNRAIQNHIKEIKELQDLCDRLLEDTTTKIRGGGFLGVIKKAVLDIKEGMDRKMAETRLRTECRALGELLIELKNNPFPKASDGFEIWDRARADKMALRDLESKLKILNEIKSSGG